jgi:hypothetical protein
MELFYLVKGFMVQFLSATVVHSRQYHHPSPGGSFGLAHTTFCCAVSRGCDIPTQRETSLTNGVPIVIQHYLTVTCL